MEKIFLIGIISIAMIVASAFGVLALENDRSYLDLTLLNQHPDPAEPGDYIEVRWKIEKSGNGMMEDLMFKLEPQYPFSIDPSDSAEKAIGNWMGYSNDDEYYVLYYKLRVDNDALEGTYDIKLGYKSKGQKSYYYFTKPKSELQLRIGQGNNPELVLGKISTSPAKILPDTDENEIAIGISNIGEGKAEMVNVRLKLPKGFSSTYSYSDIYELGNIEKSASESAVFYVDVDETIAQGSYKTHLMVKFKEEGQDSLEEKSIPFSIEVKNKPAFKIADVSFDKELLPKETIKLSLKIDNKGGKKAEGVSIRAFKETSQPFDFSEKSDFIGTLSKGSQGEAILEFEIDKLAEPKKYFLDLEIRSIDNGIVFIQQETIPIVVAEKQGSNTKAAFTGIASLVILGVLALGFFLGKSSLLSQKSSVGWIRKIARIKAAKFK
jgi:hypothetical protein